MSATSGDAFDGRARADELAFVEAGRALDAQERAVNELRARAGTLIAAGPSPRPSSAAGPSPAPVAARRC
jgi:hypothetical protein